MRSDGERTRKKIVEAACQVFDEKGYQDATHAEICRISGANIAAVNYHFGSKDGLYQATWKHLVDNAAETYPVGGGVPSDAPFEERLRGHISAIVKKITDPRLRPLHRIRFMELAHPTGLLDRSLAKPLGMCRRDADGLLRDFLGKKATKEEIELCALSILGPCLHLQQILHGNGLCSAREYSPKDIERMVDHMVRFAVAGLGQLQGRRKESSK